MDVVDLSHNQELGRILSQLPALGTKFTYVLNNQAIVKTQLNLLSFFAISLYRLYQLDEKSPIRT